MQQTTVVYEQPLNERIRAFLRLEYLFERAAFRMSGPSVWDSRATVEAIIDIMTIMTRTDLKTDIIQELERTASTLEALGSNPGVDTTRLTEVLTRIRELLNGLRAADNAPGQDLRQNELLSCVRQRSSIPAGTCSFDIPAYQHWLEKSQESRLKDIHDWFSRFERVRDSVSLCLKLLRGSANATHEVAKGGFFQRQLDSNVQCQLVRVVVPAGAPWFPEISGGRHRFSIRFMNQVDTQARPVQFAEDIDFELQCCGI